MYNKWQNDPAQDVELVVKELEQDVKELERELDVELKERELDAELKDAELDAELKDVELDVELNANLRDLEESPRDAPKDLDVVVERLSL